jgi:hypothetical protein
MGVADDWVRLGLALVIIAMVSLLMYQYAARAQGADVTFVSLDRHR